MQPRFFSANSTFQTAAKNVSELPVLTPPSVGYWLLFTTLMVYGVIVVGGVTRLTESGLSITEWKPVSGIIPPLSQAEWEEEFAKYKATPEYKLFFFFWCYIRLNSNFTLDDFKRIFFMEWGHRVLGRFIGIAFVLPLTYFAVRRKITPALTKQFAGLAVLLGLQGALGWYMVKSGLEDSILDTPGAVPRVSQYRLAAHLGAAFVLYGAMFITGHNIIRDWKFMKKGMWSGAFVAGLDAGLLYNEFPLMGGRLAPPSDELMDPAYALSPDKSDLWWRNIFENPTTVQFNHRVLAMTTYVSTGALFALTRTSALRAALPAATLRLATGAFGVANLQVLLGISTLLYLVPVPLAAAHQAGSVALLSMMITLALTLRKPGAAARLWRQRILSNSNKRTSS
ncbi:hypothetical protein EW145_g2907 [Phellinidium pouzarii]|uniref:Cytochrome c oxidase assembly protein COX15 n=1 Tax=Phellinidium pouzarii TaxID=167371 RepID=A0A4S4LEK9_9AGAM|nr:hypothetical protein EW145_g2907 [Phellinidium pouzarii]